MNQSHEQPWPVHDALTTSYAPELWSCGNGGEPCKSENTPISSGELDRLLDEDEDEDAPLHQGTIAAVPILASRGARLKPERASKKMNPDGFNLEVVDPQLRSDSGHIWSRGTYADNDVAEQSNAILWAGADGARGSSMSEECSHATTADEDLVGDGQWSKQQMSQPLTQQEIFLAEKYLDEMLQDGRASPSIVRNCRVSNTMSKSFPLGKEQSIRSHQMTEQEMTDPIPRKRSIWRKALAESAKIDSEHSPTHPTVQETLSALHARLNAQAQEDEYYCKHEDTEEASNFEQNSVYAATEGHLTDADADGDNDSFLDSYQQPERFSMATQRTKLKYANMEEARHAYYRPPPPGYQPPVDPSRPRSDSELSFCAVMLLDAALDMTEFEDNKPVIDAWCRTVRESRNEVEMGVWNVLQAMLDYHVRPNYLGKRLHSRSDSSRIETFSEHLELICGIFRRQKTACRHLVHEWGIITLVDDPLAQEQRVRSNRTVNRHKKELNEGNAGIADAIKLAQSTGTEISKERLAQLVATNPSSSPKRRRRRSTAVVADPSIPGLYTFDLQDGAQVVEAVPSPKRTRKSAANPDSPANVDVAVEQDSATKKSSTRKKSSPRKRSTGLKRGKTTVEPLPPANNGQDQGAEESKSAAAASQESFEEGYFSQSTGPILPSARDFEVPATIDNYQLVHGSPGMSNKWSQASSF